MVVQPHRIDPAEIVELLRREILARTRSGRRRDYVDKPSAVPVDLPDPLGGCLRGDEHDQGQTVPVAQRLVMLHVLSEGKVGNDQRIDPHLLAALEQALDPVLHHRVQIAHQHQRDVAPAARLFHLIEQQAEGHPVAQGHRAAALDRLPVGHRIGKRYAHLDHVHARIGQCADDLHRIVPMRETGGKIHRKDVLSLVFK